MKCPACLHTFKVTPAAGPPPIESIPLDLAAVQKGLPDDASVEDLPAPKRSSMGRIDIPKMESIALDRPAPSGPPPLPGPPELELEEDDLEDLPAPVSVEKSRPARARDAGVDLPAPAPPKRDLGVDLPGPRTRAVDLPAPKAAFAGVGVSLDAPEADDAPAEASIALDLRPKPEIDTLAPKSDTLELEPRAAATEIAPRAEATEIAPRPEATEVEPALPPIPPLAREAARPRVATPTATPAPAARAADKPPARRWGRVAVVAGGVVIVIGGIVIALGQSTGLFARASSSQVERELGAARRQIADDTLVSYKKAASSLQPLYERDPALYEAIALGAEARLAEARLGVRGEQKNAEALLAKLDDEKAKGLADADKARALRALVAGDLAGARRLLGQLLARAPADTLALVYLGWTELSVGDFAAAGAAFQKAVQAEPARAQALYGAAFAKEQLGDGAGAHELYGRTLARVPAHFGAAVGAARTDNDRAAAAAAVDKLIAERGKDAAPRELADAWATLGALSFKDARRDEAEDRFKRALSIDPDQAQARLGLAAIDCGRGRAADAVEPLKKLVAAQPKRLDARLLYVRALVDSGAAADAAGALAAAVKDAPQAKASAEVLYWQGRVLAAQAKPDRDAALQRFSDAIAADPKMIGAYLAKSSVLAALGKSEAALGALTAAEARASEDPPLMVELGEAYLGLGRAGDAEARFRRALAKDPHLTVAKLSLGTALEAEGKLADARAAYEAILADEPKRAGVKERLARVAAAEGRKADAAKLYDEALKEGAPTEALKLGAATLFLDAEVGRRDDAKKLVDAVAHDDERSAEAHLLLSRIAFEAGHPEEALPEARRAATLSDTPGAHLWLGRALEAQGKLDQAVAEYVIARRATDAATAGPASLGRARIMVRLGATKDALPELASLAKDKALRPSALLLMGDAYADLQDAAHARKSYEEAAKAAPSSGEAAFKLGRALHDAGRRKDAIRELERAVTIGGNDAAYAAETALLLGDAHRELHENEAAKKAYQRYLELAPSDAPARSEVQKQISILGGG